MLTVVPSEEHYYYTRGLRVFTRCKDVAKTEIQGGHLVWTAGNGDPMHEVCIPRMETARVKEEVGADTRMIIEE